MVLEDLDSSGYPSRHHDLSPDTDSSSISACLAWLAWLANFHASFIGIVVRAV